MSLNSADCPLRPRHTQPYAFHLTPGFESHLSWVEARVPEPDATDFVLCLDGVLMAEGIGHTPRDGIVDASVRTTWVNMQWLVGALDTVGDSGRWQLGYTTYTLLQRPDRGASTLVDSQHRRNPP